MAQLGITTRFMKWNLLHSFHRFYINANSISQHWNGDNKISESLPDLFIDVLSHIFHSWNSGKREKEWAMYFFTPPRHGLIKCKNISSRSRPAWNLLFHLITFYLYLGFLKCGMQMNPTIWGDDSDFYWTYCVKICLPSFNIAQCLLRTEHKIMVKEK